MSTHRIVSSCLVISLVIGVSSASARQDPAPSRGGPVAMTAVGGVSFGEGTAGAAAGLAVIVDLSPRFSLEGRGMYFDRGAGYGGGELSASLLVDVLPRRAATPYVSIGAGIYRAMFDIGRDRDGMMSGSINAADIPMFYGRRMGGLATAIDGERHMRGFTDPALSIGGGVRVDISPRVFLRPDVRALSVFDGGDTHTIGSVTLSVGYRF